jgi:TetR/AcrR family transcriptional regulator, transcriptional repressor for nem operon
MRRTREEAAETRRRAVETASRLYRERGLDAVTVADVMSAIGMTVGGFYRHFESRDALVAEACGHAFEQARQAHESAVASSADSEALAALFGRYLSRAHRDAPATGCPVPALLSSVARQPASVRGMFTDAVRGKLAQIEKLTRGAAPEAQLAAVASMFGALALARAVGDEGLSTRLLHDTRRYWIRTLGAPPAAGENGRPQRRRRRRAAPTALTSRERS